MKKIVAIGLIFLMSGQCLFRLGIVAYFQLNRDYIAETLCVNKEKPMTMCYGQCFLDKNLKLVDKTEKSTAPQPSKEKVEVSVFVVSPLLKLSAIETNTGKSFAHDSILPVRDISFTIFHPPSLLS